MIAAALAATAIAASAGTSVGVAEREFSLAVYRTSVPAGKVTFNVRNYGMDPHDLAVRGVRPYRRERGRTPEIRPTENARLTVTLDRPGRYELLCTLPGHAKAGMRQTITVRRAKGKAPRL